jgi:predicted GNAT superfamily acetyltransferase
MQIRALDTVAQIHEVSVLLNRIWRVTDGRNVIDPDMVRALARTGNYVAGAYDGKTMVGASVGFFAADGHLHSHVTGIAADAQGHGIGRALKFHQRDWALARGRRLISWTFDPLIARNAYFNLHVLGARAVEYLPDFYGGLSDGVNAGDATDRLYVEWPLDEPPRPAPTAHDIPALLDRDDDRPQPGTLAGAAACTVATPADVQRLRTDQPDLAVRWRMAVREALTAALAAGYRIDGITRNGHYLLEKR